MHDALFKHGDESQALAIGISHKLALKPIGQSHVNDGVPFGFSFTLHKPPF